MIANLYRWQYVGRQWFAGRKQSRLGRKPAHLGTARAPRRVLIVLTGLIGDAVMSTPVIVEARRLWPAARIVILGNRQTCDLLAACPLIDDCVLAPAIPFTLRKRKQIAELERWLKASEFDIAMILLGDEFAQVLADAQIPERVGVRGHLLAPFLTRTYDIVGPREWGPAERLGALRALEYDVQNVCPQIWVSAGARRSARRRLLDLGIPEGLPFAVVHPFGSAQEKWWPPSRVGDLADGLWREHQLRTIVVGGPETRGSLGPLIRFMIDATGTFSIPELLAVIEGARVVISTDSGPFHIAGALGRPLVGMFRALRPEHAHRYRRADTVFGRHEACQGHCRWDHCRKQPCREMDNVSIQQVLTMARRALMCAQNDAPELVADSN